MAMAIGEDPRIVCLCGSTKFLSAFEIANRDETLEGRIVLTIGVDLKFRDIDFLEASKSLAEIEAIKDRLDWLHKRKIDKASEILVLDIDGPDKLGDSTKSEIAYAREKDKTVRFWSEERKSTPSKATTGS